MRPALTGSALGRAAPLALLAVLAGWLATSASTSEPARKTPRYDPSTILVRFADRASSTRDIRAAGDEPLGATPNGVSIVKIREGRTVDERVAAYERRPGVLYAEPNFLASMDLAPPDDPAYPSQWGLGAIDALAGWTVHPGSYSATGPKIAIADSGVDSTHPDLAAAVVAGSGANCLTGVCSAGAALDDQGHGTHVAGIASAVVNNGVGIAGVAVGSAIVPVKVLDSAGTGSYAAVVSGILWAVDRGVRVVNLSLGGYGYSTTLCDAVSRASSRGVLVVAAAGNDGTSQPLYPAACPGAVGIAATDSGDGSPTWSNWGAPNTFASAPGASIYSTYWDAGGPTYATRSGTSMAAPHASGLAALLFGQDPARTPTEVREVLARTARKVGTSAEYGPDPFGTCSCSWHERYGYGVVDAEEALAIGPRPAISAFAPARGPAGTSVSLTGAGFGRASSVTMGYAPATYTVDSPTRITAIVPPGQPYGRWRVATPLGVAVSSAVFSVPLPQVLELDRLLAPVGAAVTITGSGFDDVRSVTMGFVETGFTVHSSTRITAVVPPGQPLGRWRVTNAAGTGVGDVVFAVGG